METKVITAEMREKLTHPLPAEAVTPHPTKKFLSSIKSIYVTERLNDVFGTGTWKVETNIVDKDNKMVVVKVKFSIPSYGIEYECFGGNDNPDLGDAYKGATTDALTKIASWMGIGGEVFRGEVGKTPAKPVASKPSIQGCCLKCSSSSGVQKRTVFISILIERLTRRPPTSNIPLQFWKESFTSAKGGTVVMVWSQLRTFTVVKVTSMTSPSAPYFGIEIQSPGRSISLALSWIPATSPLMVSWNTNIRIAVPAPRPVRITTGLLSNNVLIIMIAPIQIATSLSIW